MSTATTLISVDNLIEAGISPTLAKMHAPWLAAAAERFKINTVRRAAAFLGQCALETQGLTAFEENLRYSTPERIMRIFSSRVKTIEQALPLVRNPQRLANTVYSGRFGNGDFASGDGWRYRGRGAGHLTFRNNYREAGRHVGRPYEENPDLVAQPEDAALSFGSFWDRNGCAAPADAWNIDGVTRRINPAMAHAKERRDWCERFFQAMTT